MTFRFLYEQPAELTATDMKSVQDQELVHMTEDKSHMDFIRVSCVLVQPKDVLKMMTNI